MMLKVLPVDSKEEQEKLAAICHAAYEPRALCYRVTEGETVEDRSDSLLGICQFLMSGEILSVSSPGEQRDDAVFLMMRQVMNFIDLCGVHRAFYRNGDSLSDALLRRIGFCETNGEYSVELTDFFTEPCAHGHGGH